MTQTFIHTKAKRFLLWLLIVSLIMVFAGLTSAILVRRGQGDWMSFTMPAMFWWTTAIVLASSVAMQLGYRAVRLNHRSRARVYLLMALCLGMLFLWGQVMAWNQLVEKKVFLIGNPSGSFLYILTGLHGLHVVAGIIYLLIMYLPLLRKPITPVQVFYTELCNTYWHFVTILWLYLFVFLTLAV